MFIVGSGGAVASNGKYYNNYFETRLKEGIGLTRVGAPNSGYTKQDAKILVEGKKYFVDIELEYEKDVGNLFGVYLTETMKKYDNVGKLWFSGQAYTVVNVHRITEWFYGVAKKKGDILKRSYEFTYVGGEGRFYVHIMNLRYYGSNISADSGSAYVNYRVYWD